MNLENMVESGDAIAMDLFLKAMQYRCFLDTRILIDVLIFLGFLVAVHGYIRHFYGFHGYRLVFMVSQGNFMAFHYSKFTIINDAIFSLNHQDRCF